MDLSDKAVLFLYAVVGLGFVVLAVLLVSGIEVWPGFRAVGPPFAGPSSFGPVR